jgi:hypothetical protein
MISLGKKRWLSYSKRFVAMALVDFAQLFNQSLTALTRNSLTWRLDGKEVGKANPFKFSYFKLK